MAYYTYECTVTFGTTVYVYMYMYIYMYIKSGAVKRSYMY